MKTLRTYKEVIEFLEQSFIYFNDRLVNGELSLPVITVLPRGRKNAYGWHWKGRWQNSMEKEGITEINISAEFLNRSIEQVLETMLHEMVHYVNSSRGVKDCVNQRHNKHFKKVAEEVFFLEVTKDKYKGFCYTSLTDKSKEIVNDFLQKSNVEKIDLVRKEIKGNYNRTYTIVISKNQYERFMNAKNTKGLTSRELFDEIMASASI